MPKASEYTKSAVDRKLSELTATIREIQSGAVTVRGVGQDAAVARLRARKRRIKDARRVVA